MHTCDNPPCCNPAHLRIGTPTENVADMAAKNRQGDRSNHGERNGRSVLTAEQVQEIRTAYAAGGISYVKLGRRYGVTGTQVGTIVRREQWR